MEKVCKCVRERVCVWVWLPFGTRWPSNWPCPHSHRPTRKDPAGLNACSTPACQSNPRGGWHSPERTHTRARINMQRVRACVQTPSLVAACYAVPQCSGPSRFRDPRLLLLTSWQHTHKCTHTQTAEQLGTPSTTAARHEYSSMVRRWMLAEISTRGITIPTLTETSKSLISTNAWAVKHVWPCANRVCFELQRGQTTAPYSWNSCVSLKNAWKSQLFPNGGQN